MLIDQVEIQPVGTVSFTGDGGFYYHIAELETARRHNINAVIVVNNNSALNQEIKLNDIAYGGKQRGRAEEMWRFPDINFAKIAEGFGCVGLRVGVGATAVYENVTASQGSRAGLTGSALETSKWDLLPAADVEGVVFLRVWHAWGMSLSGGPTLHLLDGSARYGWTSQLGVLWQP